MTWVKYISLCLLALILAASFGYYIPAFSLQSLGWNASPPRFEAMPQSLIARDGTTYKSYWSNYLGAAGGTTFIVEACTKTRCYKALEMDGDVGPQMCLLNGDNLLITSQIKELNFIFPAMSQPKTTKNEAQILYTTTLFAPRIYVAILRLDPKLSGAAPPIGPAALGENGFADPTKPNVCGITAR